MELRSQRFIHLKLPKQKREPASSVHNNNNDDDEVDLHSKPAPLVVPFSSLDNAPIFCRTCTAAAPPSPAS
jgi:hypothetical protein